MSCSEVADASPALGNKATSPTKPSEGRLTLQPSPNFVHFTSLETQELESLILGSGGSAGGGGGGTVRSGAGGGSSTGSSPSLAGFLKECSGGVSGIDAANSKVGVCLPFLLKLACLCGSAGPERGAPTKQP